MSNSLLDTDILLDFIKRVEKNNFVYNNYKDRNGKNDFSAICSCIDWLKISTDYLNSLKIVLDNSYAMSMYIFTYIMTIDIILGCMETLKHIFFPQQMNNSNNHIFNKDKSDYKYFKYIRAVFGAHPTDINDDKYKYYASWTTSGIHGTDGDGNDVSAFLHSSSTTEYKHIEVGFKFKDMNKFVQEIFFQLKNFTVYIDNEENSHDNKYKNIRIKDSDNIFEEVEILIEESIKRFGQNSNYHRILIDIKRLMSVKTSIYISPSFIEKYHGRLVVLIKEIRMNIQIMERNNLTNEKAIYPSASDIGTINYSIEKVYEYINGGFNLHSSMIDYHLKTVSDYIDNGINISSIISVDELNLLITAGLFFKQTGRKA